MKFVQDARLIAAELRAIADRVEKLGMLPSEVRTKVTFSPGSYGKKFTEADCVASVEAIATAVVGQRAVRVPMVDESSGVHLKAETPETGPDMPNVAIDVYDAVTPGPGEWQRLLDEEEAYRTNKYPWLWEKHLKHAAGGDQS